MNTPKGKNEIRPARRYAFVIPRYCKEMGGAENLVGALANRLAANGTQVEIWATCAADNRSWENHFEPGTVEESGVLVRRFAVDPRDLECWVPLQIHISEGLQLSIEDQLTWMKESVNSSDLYQHIAEQADNFDAIFFAPYLFGTTFWGSLLRPDKSFLIPCLHDESYAYMEVIQSMFHQVRGCLFNALPEMELAQALYGRVVGAEVGMGFDALSAVYVESLKPYFSDDFEYLLYVGRKETGKNVQVLIDNFITAKEVNPKLRDLKLVIMGGGSFSDILRPAALKRDDIVDLGHLSEIDKQRVMRHALALCQPSVNESFSIVLMESWLLGVPVIVHAKCAVTRQHAIASGGGLYFSEASDFSGVLNTLAEHSQLRDRLGAAGQAYVQQVYSWEAVLERFHSAMEQMLSKPYTGQVRKSSGVI